MAEALGLAAGVIAVIDLSTKVASRCSEYYANVKNARDDIERLQGEAQRLKETLEEVQSLCDGPNCAKLQVSQTLRDGVKDCRIQLAQLETKLEPRTRQKVMSCCGIRALKWPFRSAEVDGIMEKLARCRDSISFSLLVNQAVQILNIHQKTVLDKLRSADNAAFDSHDEEHNARCYQGTRVELLRQIDTWASDRGSERIFWLNGMAGTGKSTISRTVAQNFTDKGDLGASFFFKRGEGDRGHADLFITTIATQLVQKLPSLAPHVQDAIEADPGISRKALKQQFDTLVLQPLGKIRTDPQKSSSIVVVIDALDECDREEDVRIIIRLFSQVNQITSVQLKFFLTSRPELPIRLGFEDIRGKYEGLALHQIPEPIVKEDITAFLEHELAVIREDYNKSVTQNRQLPTDWPGQTNMQSLVGMAVPLFIFATTVCRFINDRKCGQPKDQLAKVLKYETRSQASKLDATYLPVMDQLLVGVTSWERRALVEDFQQVVGSIVILANPLSATSLDRLLGVPEGTVDSRTDLLHSVLSIPSRPDHPVRLLHLSFRDFLVDMEKRKTNPFWVDEADAHNKLATRCLELLSTGDNLREDICNLRTPERPRSDIDRQTIDLHLPPDIQYACQYWVYHLKEGGSIICDDDQVYNFLKCHFLHWLESLSLIGRMSESVGMMNDLIAILDLRASIKASALIYDAKRFILRYLLISDSSPLQLYSAGLIFAPKESIVRKIFQDHIPDWISQQPEVESGWNAVLQTLEGHDGWATSVAFSHDSKLLASASEDRTVRIWDAAIGSLQQILQGHNDWVQSIVFSHNSKLLASASSDKTVKIWDVATGSLQHTLKGYSDSVNSIVFSHNSKLLASASSDKTVKIWDVATGSLQQTLEDHSSWITLVAFSHDSKLLALALSNKIVRIWDMATGSLQQTFEGHSDSVTSVAFSHDSKLLASAAFDKTIKIWNIATGSLQQTLQGHNDSVRSVVFSHNSKLLASASSDKTVRIWDAVTSSLQQTFEGHSNSVNSIVFSHDSKLLASASFDKTIKVWDTAAASLQQTLEGHTDWVHSIVFSHDSKLLASASSDKTIRIWDSASSFLQQTLKGHNSLVHSIVFSHNSKLLASASMDKTIKIWDVATASLQQTLEESYNDWVYSIVFSHDSKLLASASSDKIIKIWNVATGLLQQTLKGHSDSVRLAVFSYNSKLLVSTSCDKIVKVWDVATGSLYQTIIFNNYVLKLSFNTADSILITDNVHIEIAQIPSWSISSQEVSHKGLGISGSWVTWNAQNLLWLPPDFRAVTSNISSSSSTVAIGCQSGKVIIIGFSSAILRSYLVI